jgi:hypothetical protein
MQAVAFNLENISKIADYAYFRGWKPLPRCPINSGSGILPR